MEEKKKKPFYKKWWFVIIVILIVVGIIGSINGEDNDDVASIKPTEQKNVVSEKETTKEEPKETVVDAVVSAKDILEAYDENGVNADNLYNNKIIEVTGIVDSIDKDILDKPFITIGTGSDFEIITVQCYFKNDTEIAKIAKLKAGDTITIIGKCKGCSLNVLVENCMVK